MPVSQMNFVEGFHVSIILREVIFHRFYYRKSFANFNLWRIVAVVPCPDSRSAASF